MKHLNPYWGFWIFVIGQYSCYYSTSLLKIYKIIAAICHQIILM